MQVKLVRKRYIDERKRWINEKDSRGKRGESSLIF